MIVALPKDARQNMLFSLFLSHEEAVNGRIDGRIREGVSESAVLQEVGYLEPVCSLLRRDHYFVSQQEFWPGFDSVLIENLEQSGLILDTVGKAQQF